MNTCEIEPVRLKQLHKHKGFDKVVRNNGIYISGKKLRIFIFKEKTRVEKEIN